MREMNKATLEGFVERLNAKLVEEAKLRALECYRGLETHELGGLIIQKYGKGMAEALSILEQVLGEKAAVGVNVDEATALVDAEWRENMRARWQCTAAIDRSKPRTVEKEGQG